MSTKSNTSSDAVSGGKPILVWRFNDSRVSVVIRGHQDLARALLKSAGTANMCLSGHETQCLLPVADLHRYQRTLGLSAAQITTLERAVWSLPSNPTISVYPAA